MAVLTQDQIQQYAHQGLAGLDGGLKLSNVPTLVGLLMEIVEQVDGMSGDDKKQSVTMMVDYVLENVNIPWVPKAFVVPLMEPLVPAMVDKLIEATQGKLQVNVLPSGASPLPK